VLSTGIPLAFFVISIIFSILSTSNGTGESLRAIFSVVSTSILHEEKPQPHNLTCATIRQHSYKFIVDWIRKPAVPKNSWIRRPVCPRKTISIFKAGIQQKIAGAPIPIFQQMLCVSN
jgi:hypothetical protein